MVFLAAWWMPATTARRTRHVSLLNAVLVHLLAAATFCVLGVLVIAWLNRRDFWLIVAFFWEEIERDYRRRPGETMAVVALVVMAVEAGFVALALLVCPWGAADERLRSTFANGLRQTWLHTADALPLTLLIGGFSVLLFGGKADWSRQYWSRAPVAPTPPVMTPAALSADSPEWQRFQDLMTEYQKASNEYMKRRAAFDREYYTSRPWWYRYDDEILGFMCTGAGAWVLWALMRAVGARREVEPVSRHPMCESCGYNLTLMPLEGRCPECGEPVMDSLGPGARAGVDWERRRELGRLRAWWRTGVEAVFRPGRFGRRLRACSWVADHRCFLVGHALPLLVIGYFVLLACYYAVERRNPFKFEPDIRYIAAPAAGIAAATSVVVVSLLAGGLMGLHVGLPLKRNLVPAAMQMAGYLAPFLVVGYCFSGLLAISLFAVDRAHWLKHAARWLRVDDEALVGLCWGAPTLMMFIVFLVLLYRGTMAARYANR